MPNNNVTNVDDFACFLQKKIPIKYECDDLDETRKEITSYYVGTIRSVGVGFSGMNISFLSTTKSVLSLILSNVENAILKAILVRPNDI